METISENACFGGTQGVYKHASDATGTDMTFGLFQPVEAQDGPVPVLWYLSGLTCTHENAMTKAGAQAWAAEQGIALIFPDTSPRGPGVADDDAYDLGQGAGFYVNATQDPWAPHFQMWDYITEDLPDLVFNKFALDAECQGITGHSMGGHGALTIAMSLPERFRSVSAFSPICNPTASDWGKKQLGAYLGDRRAQPHQQEGDGFANDLGMANHGDVQPFHVQGQGFQDLNSRHSGTRAKRQIVINNVPDRGRVHSFNIL